MKTLFVLLSCVGLMVGGGCSPSARGGDKHRDGGPDETHEDTGSDGEEDADVGDDDAGGGDDDAGEVHHHDAGHETDAGHGHHDDDAGMITDEPCSPFDPRSPSAEVFIGPTGLRTRFVNAINSATTSLNLWIYDLTDTRILDAFEAAAGRGVQVRILLDGDRYAADTVRSHLGSVSGVEIREGSSTFSYFHSKTLVVDESSAIITSANMDRYSLGSERNHGAVISDAWDIADLMELFENDWRGVTADPDLSCSRLVVSPVNARDSIEDLLQHASTDLRLEQMQLADRDIRSLLAHQVGVGVRIRVILANPEWITDNAEAADTLSANGIEVRFLRTYEDHAKLIIADDTAAYVGSTNLTYTSMERNREIGVIVTDTSPVGDLVDSFDADWADADEP